MQVQQLIKAINQLKRFAPMKYREPQKEMYRWQKEKCQLRDAINQHF